jgi:hypothetical protein
MSNARHESGGTRHGLHVETASLYPASGRVLIVVQTDAALRFA